MIISAAICLFLLACTVAMIYAVITISFDRRGASIFTIALCLLLIGSAWFYISMLILMLRAWLKI